MKNEDRLLADRLGLKWDNSEIDDWDVSEADPNRFEEFIDCYQKWELTDIQKESLMALIIASFERAVEYDMVSKVDYAKILEDLIVPDFELHKLTLRYWAFPNYHDFNITSIARAILKAGEQARDISGPE